MQAKKHQQVIQEILELFQAAQTGIASLQSISTYVTQDAVSSLNHTIKVALRGAQRKCQELEILAEEWEQEEEQLLEKVQHYKQQILRMQHDAKQAHVRYVQKSKQLYEQHQKELLFAHKYHSKVNGKVAGKPTLLEQSKNVTASLERTKKVLALQLNRTSDAMINLKTGADQMKNIVTQQEGIGEDVSMSQNLIRWLRIREHWEQVATKIAFWFFWLVIIYISNKRILPILTWSYYLLCYALSWIFWPITWIYYSATGNSTIAANNSTIHAAFNAST